MATVERAPDTELLLRLRSRDRTAWEELYGEYQPRLRAFAYRLSGNVHDADDLVQETFVRAVPRLDRLDPATVDLGAYLFTTCKNLFYKQVEKSKRAEPMADVPEPIAPMAIDEDPERASLLRSQQHDVRVANGKLESRQRLVLALRELEDRSYAEIGEIVGLKENAVAQLIFRARESLRVEVRLAQVDPERFPEACRIFLPLLAKHLDGELRASGSPRRSRTSTAASAARARSATCARPRAATARSSCHRCSTATSARPRSILGWTSGVLGRSRGGATPRGSGASLRSAPGSSRSAQGGRRSAWRSRATSRRRQSRGETTRPSTPGRPPRPRQRQPPRRPAARRRRRSETTDEPTTTETAAPTETEPAVSPIAPPPATAPTATTPPPPPANPHLQRRASRRACRHGCARAHDHEWAGRCHRNRQGGDRVHRQRAGGDVQLLDRRGCGRALHSPVALPGSPQATTGSRSGNGQGRELEPVGDRQLDVHPAGHDGAEDTDHVGTTCVDDQHLRRVRVHRGRDPRHLRVCARWRRLRRLHLATELRPGSLSGNTPSRFGRPTQRATSARQRLRVVDHARVA